MRSQWIAPWALLALTAVACGVPHYVDCHTACRQDRACPEDMFCSYGQCTHGPACLDQTAPGDGGSGDTTDREDAGATATPIADVPTTPRIQAVALLETAVWRNDYQTVASAESRYWIDQADYWWVYQDGWVYTQQAPGTVPLTLYFSDTIRDNMTAATAEAAAWASDHGYRPVRTEGYVYPDPQPGTVPLNLYWNDYRFDNLTTADRTAQQEALATGYVLVRTEGYVFAQPPYVPVCRYWNAVIRKNATTALMSAATRGLESDHYGCGVIEAAFVRYPVPGTTPIETYYNPTTFTYLTAARPEDKEAALGDGFLWIQLEGYLFDEAYADHGLGEYWLLSVNDTNYVTTALDYEKEIDQANGFRLVGVQGYGFNTQ
jgi:hypothetical protein